MKETVAPIDQAGRIVLPKGVRDELAIKAGDVFTVSVHGTSVTLTPKKPATGPRFVRKGKALVFVSGEKGILRASDVEALLEESREERHESALVGFRRRAKKG